MDLILAQLIRPRNRARLQHQHHLHHLPGVRNDASRPRRRMDLVEVDVGPDTFAKALLDEG